MKYLASDCEHRTNSSYPEAMESALIFLVVAVVLPIEGLSRGDGRSRALSPQSLGVFLQLPACLQARDLISDIKTDRGNAHLLSFLKALFYAGLYIEVLRYKLLD